jgi:hypothetical protein
MAARLFILILAIGANAFSYAYYGFAANTLAITAGIIFAAFLFAKRIRARD